MSTRLGTVSCPKCDQTNVRKITSIISEGITYISHQTTEPIEFNGRTYYVPLEKQGRAISLLAKRLSVTLEAPSKPINPIMPTGCTVTMVVVSLLVGCGSILTTGMGFGGIGLIAGVIIVPISIYQLYTNASNQKLKKESYEKSLREYNIELQKYTFALEKQSRLYYCYQDDVVFDPEDSRRLYISPESIEKILYQPKKIVVQETWKSADNTPRNKSAVASLVFGLGGWAFFPILGAFIAIIVGHVALRAIHASEGAQRGRNMAVAGLIGGYVQVILYTIFFVYKYYTHR